MHCSALLLANWRPNHSREPQRPPRSRNLVNLDISKAATRMVTAHVQPDRDPAEVRQSAAARQHTYAMWGKGFVPCRFEVRRDCRRSPPARPDRVWKTLPEMCRCPGCPTRRCRHAAHKGNKGRDIHACIRNGEGRQGGEMSSIVGWVSVGDMVANDGGNAV